MGEGAVLYGRIEIVTDHFIPLMADALKAATKSPDPSTQNGAVLACNCSGGRSHAVVAACNDFPLGVKHSEKRWERPVKYYFVEHAERSVLWRAVQEGLDFSTDSYNPFTLVSPWAACADCARAIIQSGVRTLVRMRVDSVAHWDKSIAAGDAMLDEAGVQIVELNLPRGSFPAIPPLRRNGELWQP